MDRIHYTTLTFILLLFASQQLVAQLASSTELRSLQLNTEIILVQGFTVPASAKSIMLDSGKGKICSCQYFAKESEVERTFKKSEQYTLRSITIKGLFDGSQMHVARVYFNENSGYFKFKCYTRDILLEDLASFLTTRNTSLVKQE